LVKFTVEFVAVPTVLGLGEIACKLMAMFEFVVPLVTVNAAALLVVPPTVTVTFVAPAGMEGTDTLIEVFDHEFTVAAVDPKFTVPWLLPKFAPVMVTAVPGLPEVGLMVEMEGVPLVDAAKEKELVARPAPPCHTSKPASASIRYHAELIEPRLTASLMKA